MLLFDEADALFGRRSQVKDAHDRYANLEGAFLLQRVEDYDGLTVLATNLRGNLDDAFARRLRHIVEFPVRPHRRDPLRIAQRVHDAIDRIGTEEQWIYDALAGLTGSQVAVVQAAYLEGHGETIESAIRDDMSGAEADRLSHWPAATRPARPWPASTTRWPAPAPPSKRCTRRCARCRPSSAEVAARYKAMYHETLDAALIDDFSDQELERTRALAAGDVDRTDALALDEAVLDHDVTAMDEVHKQIRSEVAAAHPDYNSTQLEAEVRRPVPLLAQSFTRRWIVRSEQCWVAMISYPEPCTSAATMWSNTTRWGPLPQASDRRGDVAVFRLRRRTRPRVQAGTSFCSTKYRTASQHDQRHNRLQHKQVHPTCRSTTRRHGQYYPRSVGEIGRYWPAEAGLE